MQVKKSKKSKKSKYIKQVILIVFIALLVTQGVNCVCTKYKKINYQYTTQIGCGLFIECYIPYQGGVFGGDIRSYYLTDSLKLNKFMGSEDDNEYLSFECDGSNVIVKRYMSKGYSSTDTMPNLKDSTIYSLMELKN